MGPACSRDSEAVRTSARFRSGRVAKEDGHSIHGRRMIESRELGVGSKGALQLAARGSGLRGPAQMHMRLPVLAPPPPENIVATAIRPRLGACRGRGHNGVVGRRTEAWSS